MMAQAGATFNKRTARTGRTARSTSMTSLGPLAAASARRACSCRARSSRGRARRHLQPASSRRRPAS